MTKASRPAGKTFSDKFPSAGTDKMPDKCPGGWPRLELTEPLELWYLSLKTSVDGTFDAFVTLAMKTVNKTATVLPWGAIGRPFLRLFQLLE